MEISCYFLIKWKDDRLVLSDDILRTRYPPLQSGAAAQTNKTNGGMMATAAEEQWFPVDLEFVEKVRIFCYYYRILILNFRYRTEYRNKKSV